MRHTLLAFCALMACVFDPVAGVPVCATHVATKRETTTKVFVGIRIARSWGEILPPVRHSMPAIEHCQKTVAGFADDCQLQTADWFSAPNSLSDRLMR